MDLRGFSIPLKEIGQKNAIFEASDQDTVGPTYQYYGFLNVRGYWVILRFDMSVANIISYRYAAGLGTPNTYSTSWTNRAALNYALYNAMKFNQ